MDQAITLMKDKKIDAGTVEVPGLHGMEDPTIAFHLAMAAVLADHSFDLYMTGSKESRESRFHLDRLTLALEGSQALAAILYIWNIYA